jgi:hypothetical protein
MSKVIPLPDRTQRLFARVDAHPPTLSPEGQRLFLIQLIAGGTSANATFSTTARSIRKSNARMCPS